MRAVIRTAHTYASLPFKDLQEFLDYMRTEYVEKEDTQGPITYLQLSQE